MQIFIIIDGQDVFEWTSIEGNYLGMNKGIRHATNLFHSTHYLTKLDWFCKLNKVLKAALSTIIGHASPPTKNVKPLSDNLNS